MCVFVCVFLQGTAQLSLADCEGSADMVYHWLPVQMLAEMPRHEQKNLSHRRLHDNHDDEQRPRATVVKSHVPLTAVCCVFCSRVALNTVCLCVISVKNNSHPAEMLMYQSNDAANNSLTLFAAAKHKILYKAFNPFFTVIIMKMKVEFFSPAHLIKRPL